MNFAFSNIFDVRATFYSFAPVFAPIYVKYQPGSVQTLALQFHRINSQSVRFI